MAASGHEAKKKNKKGKTLTLTDFLAEDKGGSSNAPPSYPAKSTSWADETDDLDGDVTTSWHTDEDSYRAPAIDRSVLPTAPRSAREPNVDRSRLPRSPPYTAFLGNLPYDVTEDSIKDFFRGLAISAVRLPREPSNPERLKGFGYAEFDDVDSLLRALSLNEENLGNRRIRVDIADQSNDKERDNGSMGGRDRGGRMSDLGPDKTDTDWRARPSSDADDGPPKRDDAFGERPRGDRYESDRFRDGARQGNDRYDGGRDRFRDRYDDRDRRDYDRGGFDSRGGSGGGRRAFGSGFRRDYDDNRGSSDRYGGDRDRDRYGGDRGGERGGEREDRYERRDERREERGGGGGGPGEGEAGGQRPKLNLKPRSVPKEEEGSGGGGGGGGGGGSGGGSSSGGVSPAAAPSSGSRTSSIFGAAKPVDTAAKEREVEERLKKEEERLQRQLEEDKGRGGSDRKIRDRDPSWRTEESHPQRSRTGSESSQQGSTSGRGSRCRDNERSGENEVFSGREGEPSSPGTSPLPPSTICSKEPLKVMPAPPPKENAWAKRSAASTSSNEGDGRPPVSPVSPGGSAPPKLSSPSSADEIESGKDENKADGVRRDRGPPRARGGPAGPGAGRGRGEGPNRDRRKEADRKDNRRDRDSRPPPEPKKFGEPPTPKFSSASKYAALLMDGDQGDDAEDVE
ncbi:eukaryotic translation initiation factor 4Ba isoform X3 [Sebastes umbrosus]|uniref:eukaryotic translation initiation factor 4Ba isoform X3 n=1 Tax=Sebastes umbrosus TaxID=72105 RepID=UPI00189E036B|nr:eukaryotic translation initiation factor 4Ba isoform X3 [Sebastes umbrosus]